MAANLLSAAAFLLGSFFQEEAPKITAPISVNTGQLFIVEIDGDKSPLNGTWQFYPEMDDSQLQVQEAVISGETKLLINFLPTAKSTPSSVLILYGYAIENNIEILVHPLTIGNNPNPQPPIPVPPTPEFDLTSFVKTNRPAASPIIGDIFQRVAEMIELELVENTDAEKINMLTAELYKKTQSGPEWDEFMDKLAEELSKLSEDTPLDHIKTWKEIAKALE